MADIITKIKAVKSSKSRVWRCVADLIVEDPQSVIDLNLREFGKRAGVSEGSVVNFARSLGYDGYVELKVAVAQAEGALAKAAEASYGGSFETFVNAVRAGFDEALSSVDSEVIDEIARVISDCDGRIMVCGKSTSGYIGKILAGYLVRLKAPAYFADECEIASGGLRNGDVLIAITYSGNTDEIVNTVQNAHKNGAKCYAITSFRSSRVAKECDGVVEIKISESKDGEFPLVSRIVELAVCDAICAKVSEIKKEKV